MPRFVRAAVLAAMALVLPLSSALGADKGGCPSAASGWQLSTPEDAADMFFPHLLPGAFETADEFESVIDANDNDDNDQWVCIRVSWGSALNPKSHWYQVGVNGPLEEPVYVLSVIDNTAAAQTP